MKPKTDSGLPAQMEEGLAEEASPISITLGRSTKTDKGWLKLLPSAEGENMEGAPDYKKKPSHMAELPEAIKAEGRRENRWTLYGENPNRRH